MNFPVSNMPNPLASPLLPSSYGMPPAQNQTLGSSSPVAATQPVSGHSYGSWASPSQWVNSARIVGGNVRDELQKAFPGNYAHLIGWQPLKSAQMNAKDT